MSVRVGPSGGGSLGAAFGRTRLTSFGGGGGGGGSGGFTGGWISFFAAGGVTLNRTTVFFTGACTTGSRWASQVASAPWAASVTTLATSHTLLMGRPMSKEISCFARFARSWGVTPADREPELPDAAQAHRVDRRHHRGVR